ncbi:hypothetical protein [Leuconostoc rapi]|uniref:hypothetical protein n=1 Tax=Leuconostoc rapi TaxID=1406906 RepID=UPI001EF949D0|nr:hypothetical protein [Leuconostoc rapi]MBM7435666.1 ABC-type glycerol-3-phosphate transport system permease component [Leuconostoc rapi]
MQSNAIQKTIRFTGLTVIAIVLILPLLLGLSLSLSSSASIAQGNLIPNHLVLNNYVQVFTTTPMLKW